MIEELLQVRCFNQLIGSRLSLTSNPLMHYQSLVRTIENPHPMSHWHNIDNNNNLSDVGVRNATSQTRCGFCGNQISHGYIKRDQTNDQKTPNKNNKPQTNTSTAPTPNFMCKKRVSPRLCRVATRTTWTLTVAGLLNGLTTGFPRGG